MQGTKTRRRKMGDVHEPDTSVAVGQIGKNSILIKRSRNYFDTKMQENLRTALFYFFALMISWFLFCFLTFIYFTSSSHPFDDHRHILNQAQSKLNHRRVEGSDGTGADKDQSITDATQASDQRTRGRQETAAFVRIDKLSKIDNDQINMSRTHSTLKDESKVDYDKKSEIDNVNQRVSKTDISERLSKINHDAQAKSPDIDHDQGSRPNIPGDHRDLSEMNDKSNRTPKIDADQSRDATDHSHIKTDHDQTPCWGLCPEPGDQSNQLDYVVMEVQKYVRKKQKENIQPTEFPLLPEISVPRKPKFAYLETLKIVKATLPAGGNEARIILQTDDGLRLIFKPETPANQTSAILSPKKDRCRVAGRYNSELAAYYLSLLIPIVQVPQVVGVKLNLTSVVWPVRTNFFLDHSWLEAEDDSRCFKSTCRYCRRAICATPQDLLPGSLSVWRPPSSFSKFDNPWSEICSKRGTEKWRHHWNFCQNATLKSEYRFFATAHDHRIGLLRLIDTAIFDYLIDYPDRNSLYYNADTSQSSGFVLIDNSKAFIDVDHGDMAVLAPLFQCCQIDGESWKILDRLESRTKIARVTYPENSEMQGTDFQDELLQLMAVDELYPVLDYDHLRAIERRLQKVIAVINLCIEKHGSDQVLRN